MEDDLIDKLLEEEDEALASPAPPAGSAPELRVVMGYKVPPSARRIKVVDEKGKIAWRAVEDVRPTDVPELNTAGEPIFMFGNLGRPPAKNNLHDSMAATSPVAAELIKIKTAQINSDPILKIAEDQPESGEVLNQVMLGLIEESASLRFERMEAERNGKDASTFSMRRVQALKAIGDTWIKRKEQISERSVDLESPAFQALFQFIAETFTRAMQTSGVRGEQCDTVVSAFAKMLDDTWKSEANRRMKG